MIHKMTFFRLILFSLTSVLILVPSLSLAGASETYTFIVKKQEKKEQSRWSLASWLATKREMRMQDMWLAMNSSDTTSEGFIGGDYSQYNLDTNAFSTPEEREREANRALFGLYYSIFGIEAQYFDGNEPVTGYNASFHLRILGTGIQNSGLTLEYGLRSRTENIGTVSEEMQNQFAGVKLTLYLIRKLGVEGLYRHIFSKESKSGNVIFEGKRTEATLFVEVSVFRLYATLFEDDHTYDRSGTIIEQKRKGVIGGARIYF